MILNFIGAQSLKNDLLFQSDDSLNDIAVQDFSQNSEFFEDILKNQSAQWTIINVWATWCVPCLNEIPELDDFNLTDKTVVFKLIGITYESLQQTDLDTFFQKKFQSKPSYAIHIGNAPSLKLQQQLNDGMPQTFIFDPNGRLRNRHLGELSSAMLRFKIQELQGN